MLFIGALTIPANTAESTPEVLVCRLTYGTISRGFVCFPPGPKGLAHVIVTHHEAQLWPTNRDESFAWDNFVFEFEEEFELSSAPYSIKIVGWNDDDTYDHTVTVMLNVLRGRYGLRDLLSLQAPLSYLEV